MSGPQGGALQQMMYGQTCSTGTATTALFVPHQHCYGVVRVTANQHQRTEHRRCSCGHETKRVTRWAERRVFWERPS